MTSRSSNLLTSRKLRPLPVFMLMLALFILFTLVLQVEGSENYDQEPIDATKSEDVELLALIISKPSSGFSYWEERDQILEMDRLETIEEMEAFVQRYESPPQNQEHIRDSLSAAGLTIVVQDDLFTVVVGTADAFAPMLGATKSLQLIEEDSTDVIAEISTQELNLPPDLAPLVDGMIIQKLPEMEPNTLDMEYSPEAALKNVDKCPAISIQPDDVSRALKLDRLHDQGLTGQGVDIGFIDSGLSTAHSYFTKGRTVNLTFYRFDSPSPTDIIEVPHTYESSFLEMNDAHGFMVAAYLAAAAPDAKLHAFAKPYSKNKTPDAFMVAYLIHMRKDDLVDVLSLSQAWWEEDKEANSYLPAIRTQFIKLMAEQTIVLISSGNSGQRHNGFTSGHNSLAAIPEVLAIGGSTLVPKGQDFTFKAAGEYPAEKMKGITGAASFESTIFPGRDVPDIVGVFGNPVSPSFCYPYPVDRLWPIADQMSTYRVSKSNGTSGAAPQIAGMAALLKQRFPWLSQSQMRSILQNNTVDIVSGKSGDGDRAKLGHDLATGFGIPMATWALQSQVSLENGWNLIGVTSNKPYSGVDLLNEIYKQGGSCNTISYWSTSHGAYRTLIVEEDGAVFGQNFDIEPEVGYWLRCHGKFIWQPGGNGYIVQPQPIDFHVGWNSVAVPYSNVSCTSGDLYHGTGAACYRVLKYDGLMQETQPLLTNSGRDFLLHPGEGYMVFCDNEVKWTPVCTDKIATYEPLPEPAPANNRLMDAGDAARLVTQIEQSQRQGQAVEIDECVPTGGGPLNETNITEQQFTINWLTEVPCMGSVVLLDRQGKPILQAFDDRGDNFSGTTHLVTVRGLQADTEYRYGLFSGDEWYDADTGWLSPFTVKTGTILRTPGSQYSVRGDVVAKNGGEILDGYIDLFLEGDDSSDHLTFPLGHDSSGFLVSLDNVRNRDSTAYYNFSAADSVAIRAFGNAGDTSYDRYSIDLKSNKHVSIPKIKLEHTAPIQTKLVAPSDGRAIKTLRPTLRFKAADANSSRLTYRLELSKDNFSTVAYTYDQSKSSKGWSAASYASGKTASFKVPDKLDNLSVYQWRAFAYDGQSWGPASPIRTFSILIPVWLSQTYLPLTKK